MKTNIIHNQAYDFYSWENMGDDIFVLAKKIIKSGQKFDRIIALAKGGLTLSRSLVDFLGVKQLSSIQIEFYTGIGKTNKTPVITQSLPVSIRGERILIFDDIVDQGTTMDLAKEYIQHHGAKSICTAALIEKPWSTHRVDFSARSTQSWVLLPHEVREMITLLNNLWQEKGDKKSQIKENLTKLGFSKAEVELFLDIK